MNALEVEQLTRAVFNKPIKAWITCNHAMSNWKVHAEFGQIKISVPYNYRMERFENLEIAACALIRQLKGDEQEWAYTHHNDEGYFFSLKPGHKLKTPHKCGCGKVYERTTDDVKVSHDKAFGGLYWNCECKSTMFVPSKEC